MVKTWCSGQRLFRDNFNRRLKMFEAIVYSVALWKMERKSGDGRRRAG